MVKIKMIPSQAGAFEVYVADSVLTEDVGIDDEWKDYSKVAGFWNGGSLLKFDESDAETVRSILVEASNSADSEHERTGDRMARGAAESLGNLSIKVAKEMRKDVIVSECMNQLVRL